MLHEYSKMSFEIEKLHRMKHKVGGAKFLIRHTSNHPGIVDRAHKTDVQT